MRIILESREKERELMGALRGHIRELEEQVARGLPMVNLVENMVKLASLYKGPEVSLCYDLLRV